MTMGAGSAAAQTSGDGILVIGDSLEVGSTPHLRRALAGLPLEIDARGSRPSREGVAVLADRLGPEHGTIVFPLGTNDIDPNAFAANLAAVRELAAGRCIVVATISRPPLRGSAAGPLNDVIEAFAAQGGVQVADWRSAVATSPGALVPDRIHGTDAGYALRAGLLAEAVQGCLLGADLGGIPAPRNPDARPPGRERTDEPPPPAEPPPAEPVRLPAPLVLGAVGAALDRALSTVDAALRDARTAALPPQPEPVLGAP
jgi:hypothetical protein